MSYWTTILLCLEITSHILSSFTSSEKNRRVFVCEDSSINISLQLLWSFQRSFYFLSFFTMEILNTPIHNELRTLIQDEPGITGEMSIRPRIQRAIDKLMNGKDRKTLPEDILLMHRIAGYNPTSPAPQIHRIYDSSLTRLSEIMNQSGLYKWESHWTDIMTK